ncbi:uncharacterized protein PgNI_07409 [Pyricularia grisea]|uniref:Uncharacterized protein n=1 Tax=Pyricularia grisea TaxID=148305 RepID=A0A6P8B329_PYRGI|nr:uncharacterized protein PgNI_07409 [Pyricularia grisea]TLD09271.1 hypothetical protein PgNI_07409 [Pyricularia grisea]
MDRRRSPPSPHMEADKTYTAEINAIPSFSSHGTLEAKEFNWEICIPTDQMDKATAIFENSPDYEPAKPMLPQPFSLIHTYPHFKRVGINIIFVLVPSFDVHFNVKPGNITRSFNDIPFPKLEVLVQSHIERNDTINLTDLVDGADLSEEWGYENLELEGKNDGEWVAKINAVAEAMPDRPRDRPPTLHCSDYPG